MKYIFAFIFTLFLSFTYAQTTEEHIQEAKKLSKEGDWWQCVDKSTLAIQIDSTNASYYWVRSKCLANDKKFDAALFDINKTIELSDKPTAKMYVRMGSIYYYQGKNTAHQAIVVKDNDEDSFDDPNPEEKAKEKLKYYNNAKLLFEHALHTFAKAIEVNPEIESDLEDFIYMANRDLKKVNKQITTIEK